MGLSLAQLIALSYLAECNRFSDTPAAVAEFLDATRGTTSQTLKALEHKGLIARHGDERDGRVQHLRLTPVGRRTVDETSTDEITRAIETLGTGAAPLEAALEQILRAAQRARGGRTFGLCGTCRHLQGTPGHHVCGLTRESLHEADATLRCVEHDPFAA